ncbi:MAG: hypothetical protein MUO76_11120 [Anaerolineaceae bacterium]|nr:hypothetical protein [Anaerolineaceae bacterium]
MKNETTNHINPAIESQMIHKELIERLLEVAKPDAVYGEPIEAGEYIIIPAAEVSLGLGIGHGPVSWMAKQNSQEDPSDQPQVPEGAREKGSGGGGGGWGGSRPVAVISVGPAGVEVKPVFDWTKLGLAFLTTLGSIFYYGSRIRRGIK